MRRQEGPPFGARALVELTAPGRPLHGLEVQFQHHAYNWNDTAPLVRLLAGLAARGAVIAASSEGGLFEYGSDEAVVANLTVLARAGVPIVAGSVTSSSKLRKRMIAHTKFQLFARGLEGFAPLAEPSGYHVAESRTAIVSEQVVLRATGTLSHSVWTVELPVRGNDAEPSLASPQNARSNGRSAFANCQRGEIGEILHSSQSSLCGADVRQDTDEQRRARRRIARLLPAQSL
ncbi:hypothetical protein SAZ10_00575 [Mesorhizobium sp. BAC0120]|uniref:hypothetical protein n=1 Tax=Mesorhizobium sp. BAC0120 TaxID=3090670 RepID=UPI00298D0F65|nr:hypothetical protein [Mesorhizobium sp. BAC0120]MDW6020250.1 hypothetical protein [Mesorhizobium sp. BAC0120]